MSAEVAIMTHSLATRGNHRSSRWTFTGETRGESPSICSGDEHFPVRARQL